MSQTAGSSVQNPKPNRVAPTEQEKENRDPNNINEHLKAEFYDIFAEPKEVHSFDCTWELSEICFSCFKNGCYKFFTLLCGCCIAMYWAWEFAPVIFHHVWCLTPSLQLFNIMCGFWCKNFWLLCVRCFVSPITQSVAPFFRFCGDGLNKRMETPSIFPNWDRKTKVVAVPKVKKPNSPEPTVVPQSQWEDYDKEKIAKSVKRQLLLM